MLRCANVFLNMLIVNYELEYTLIQCTPLLVEKAGVAPDVTFGINARKQNRSNQWLHKLGLGPTKNLKKKKKKKNYELEFRQFP